MTVWLELAGPSVATILAFRRRRIGTPCFCPLAQAGEGDSVVAEKVWLPPWFRLAVLMRMGVDRIDPVDGLRLLDRGDVEIDDDRFLVAAHEDAFERLRGAGVDLLMRHVRRHVDEIARSRLGDEFEPIAPAHAGPPLDDIDDALERAVMMRPGFRVGVDGDRAGPQLLRAGAGEVDRRGARHARCLRRVGVEILHADDAHAVGPPILLAAVLGHLDLLGRPCRYEGDIYAAMRGQCKRTRAEAVSDAVALARRGMEELVRLQAPYRQALSMVGCQEGVQDVAVRRQPV